MTYFHADFFPEHLDGSVSPLGLADFFASSVFVTNLFCLPVGPSSSYAVRSGVTAFFVQLDWDG